MKFFVLLPIQMLLSGTVSIWHLPLSPNTPWWKKKRIFIFILILLRSIFHVFLIAPNFCEFSHNFPISEMKRVMTLSDHSLKRSIYFRTCIKHSRKRRKFNTFNSDMWISIKWMDDILSTTSRSINNFLSDILIRLRFYKAITF